MTDLTLADGEFLLHQSDDSRPQVEFRFVGETSRLSLWLAPRAIAPTCVVSACRAVRFGVPSRHRPEPDGYFDRGPNKEQ